MHQIVETHSEVKNGNELHFTARRLGGKKDLHVSMKIEDKEVLDRAFDVSELALEEMDYGLIPCSQKSLRLTLESCHDQVAVRVARSRYERELKKLIGEKKAKRELKEENNLMTRGARVLPGDK